MIRNNSPLSSKKSSPMSDLSSDMISKVEQKNSQELTPVQYHRLKISYFRRLNLLPVLSVDEADGFISEVAQKQDRSYKIDNRETAKSEGLSRASSLKSFLPTQLEPTQPIKIPASKKRSGWELNSNDLDSASIRNDESPSGITDDDEELQKWSFEDSSFSIFLGDLEQ